jgi:glycosyltransferase involved in cell wall biosynthesis
VTALVLSRFRPDDVRGGAALRNWQNIRMLARLGPVDVASIGATSTPSRVTGVRAWAAFPSAPADGRHRLPGEWLLYPHAFPGAAEVYSPRALEWMRDRMAEARYDVIVIEGLVLAAYMHALRRLGVPLIFDAHNVESALCEADMAATYDRDRVVRRIKNAVVRRRLSALESYAVRTADVVWACSERDAAEIQRRFRPAAPIVEVVNGVDVTAYGYSAERHASVSAGDWSHVPITLVYPGLFSYRPNEDAALRLVDAVLPAIRARGYRARIVLAGRAPTPALLERARRDLQVTVTGEVESIVPILQQPCVVALPITVGSGTRLKIVEAFAAGCPVVTTAKGAEGLQVRDEEHLLIREDPEAIAAAAIDLWYQPEWRRRLSARAFALVCQKYSWSAAGAAIDHSLTRLRPGGSSPVALARMGA